MGGEPGKSGHTDNAAIGFDQDGADHRAEQERCRETREFKQQREGEREHEKNAPLRDAGCACQQCGAIVWKILCQSSAANIDIGCFDDAADHGQDARHREGMHFG